MTAQTPRTIVGRLAATLLLLASVRPAVSAQEIGSVVGRAFDAVSGEPVAEMEVRIDGTDLSAVTDLGGTFRMQGVPAAGPLVVRLRHPDYGARTDTVDVEPGRAAALRVYVAPGGAPLRPVVVEVAAREEGRARSRGSERGVLVREEIRELAGRTSGVLALIEREIPGVRVSNRSTVAARFCLELRGVARSLQDDPGACNYPLVLLDASRVEVAALGSVMESLSLDDVQRIEMIPPARAGVEYGTGSQNGVLLIETGARAERPARTADMRSELRPRTTYNWAVEGTSHHTYRALGAAFVGNAAGVALGLWIGSQCIDYDLMPQDFFHSRCGGWTTLGARLAVVGLPLLGSTLGARWAGRTRASEGDWKKSAGIATILILPGYIMAASGLGEAGSPPETAGKVMLSLGVPTATALADRLFRHVRFQGAGGE